VLGDWAGGRRAVLLCDRNLARLHLERYQEVLNDPLVIVLPPGEGSKTLNGARKIYRAMLEARVERGDLLVALGGGVTTDLGAFAAATYKRGMDFALVSTSLLGCVDAAVGGKAAVNLDHTKNTVGCFTRPLGVILDLRALGTLARRHRAEGAVEAYKTGLAADADLAGFVRDYLQPILAGDLPAMARAAGLSARVKARVVSRDFREAGLRRILNLGHTYGHAVEGVNRFRVSHGRAVAAGIMAAAAVSEGRSLLDGEAAGEIMRAMKPLAPKPDKWPRAREAWRVMVHDKKNQNRRVLYVLLEQPGRAIWVDDVGPDELQRALERMEGV
jgi:3-dehydroquinate synthetase